MFPYYLLPGNKPTKPKPKPSTSPTTGGISLPPPPVGPHTSTSGSQLPDGTPVYGVSMPIFDPPPAVAGPSTPHAGSGVHLPDGTPVYGVSKPSYDPRPDVSQAERPNDDSDSERTRPGRIVEELQDQRPEYSDDLNQAIEDAYKDEDGIYFQLYNGERTVRMNDFAESGLDEISDWHALLSASGSIARSIDRYMNGLLQHGQEKPEAEAAQQNVIKDVTNDKLESLTALDMHSGDELYVRYGGPSSTTMQGHLVDETKDRKVVWIHNHPNNTGASKADREAAFEAGVQAMMVVTPAGFQYPYIRGQNTMVPLKPIFNPAYIAAPSLLETVQGLFAYVLQSAAEADDPAEWVLEQEGREDGIYTPVGLTVEQTFKLFNVDSERERRLKWKNYIRVKKNTYEEKLLAWEKMWTKDPEIWADYDAIERLAPFISEVAQRWNFPESGMSEYEVAVLLIANLHQESVLRRDNPADNHYLNQLGVFKDILGDANFSFRGADSSLGPANLRLSVVDEILGEFPVIPMHDGSSPEFDDEGRLDALEQEWQSFGDSFGERRKRISFLYDPENAIELMGANFRRGIERLHEQGLEPTMFNMSAWLSQGIAESDDLRSIVDNKDVTRAIDHASDTVRFVNAIIANRETFGMFDDSDVVIDWDSFVLFNDDDLLAYLRD